jgi:hypothetical protein
MTKYLCVLLLVTTKSYSITVATASAAGAAASANASHAAHVATIAASQQQMSLKQIHSNNKIIGVMQCAAHYRNIKGSEAYDMNGCVTPNGTITIEQFFEKNRLSKKYVISQIIYNDYKGNFIIYYSKDINPND